MDGDGYRGKDTRPHTSPPYELVEIGSKVGQEKSLVKGLSPVLCPHTGERGPIKATSPISIPGLAVQGETCSVLSILKISS
jgi:hypothetical protein